MSHYRIKIDQLHNGETKYSIQESHLEITGGWIKHPRIVWENLFTNFETEEEAMSALENYRTFLETKKLKEVKSTTYKII